MKSVQFTGIRQLEILDVPKPELKNSDDILLKIAAVGVCGSDIHYYADGNIGDQVLEYPFAAGHEVSAIVEQVGEGVAKLKSGDRVAVEPAVSCGECDQCLAGRENTCRKLMFLGCPGELAGCLGEFIVMPERNCFKVPDSMTMAQAAFAEPLSIAIYAVKYLKNRDIKTCAILGAGPIGLSVQLEARFKGIEKIYTTDKINSRLTAAKNVGAIWTGNPDETDVVDEILKHEPEQLDCVIECCGKQEAIDQAVDILKPGGILLIVGIPVEQQISFNISKIRRKELTIQNIRRQNECLGTAIERIDKNQIDVDFMITHKGPIEDTKALYDTMADYEDGVLKAIIEV
jgi:L-iditol 2-dehydrogenase